MKLGPVNNKKQYYKKINKVVKSFTGLPNTDSFYDVTYYYLLEKAQKWEWFEDFESMMNILRFSDSTDILDTVIGSWDNLKEELMSMWVEDHKNPPSFMGFIKAFSFSVFLEDCHKEFDKIVGIEESPSDDIDEKIDEKDGGGMGIEI